MGYPDSGLGSPNRRAHSELQNLVTSALDKNKKVSQDTYMNHLYPHLKIDHIKNPSRAYAIPLLGFIIKAFMVIPVAIELGFLKMAQFFFSILNACNIFFRGRYWKAAYALNLGIMQLESNVALFMWGLTDVYPGFSLKTTNYEMDIDFNKTPNRILATPFVGLLFRLVLMIPYLIYRQVIATAAFLAIFVSWTVVLFTGRYPESTYEIARDSVRVDQATTMYFLGMSDTYPSFWISFNHKAIKILLLVLSALFTLWSWAGGWGPHFPGTYMHKNAPMQVISHSANSVGY